MRTLEELAEQLDETLRELNVLATHIVSQATVWRTSPFNMMGKDGNPALAPIIIARAQALAAYTAIQVDIRTQERFETARRDAEQRAREMGLI